MNTYLKINSTKIINDLQQSGFSIINNCLDIDFLKQLTLEANELNSLNLNNNDVPTVFYASQTYLTHAIAKSENFYKIVTDLNLRKLASSYLRVNKIILKCSRMYTSKSGHRLRWHNDMKAPLGPMHNYPGITGILYLNDTFNGELMGVSGSHRWINESGQTEFSDEEIAIVKDKVVSFKGKAGTLILMDTKTIHSTAQTEEKFHRKTIFFQIDAFGSGKERFVVNPDWIDPSDTELLEYLGFGVLHRYESMPSTKHDNLPASILLNLITSSLGIIIDKTLIRLRKILQLR